MDSFVVVTSVVIHEGGRFLLAKRSAHEDVYPGMWAIPGGKLEATCDPFGTLEGNVRREVREEIGVDLSVDTYLESHAITGKLYITFMGRIREGIPRPLDDTDEVKWVNLAEAELLPLCPNVIEALRIAESTLRSLGPRKSFH